MLFFSSKEESTADKTPVQVLADFQRSLDRLIGQTLNGRVDRRQLATALESAAQGLRVIDSTTRAVR
jgi:hypothetical protein